jgi:hypothetical protein
VALLHGLRVTQRIREGLWENLTVRLSLIAAATVLAVVACDQVPLTSPTGSTITISIDRSVLPLNGQATVRAVIVESSGTPVHNGTSVTFSTTIGSTDPVEARTVNGIATATFNAGAVSGTGTIHAFSGGASTGSGNSSSGGVTVTIGAAAARGMSVSATPPSVSQSGGTVTISALVMDESNNPLPGVSVLFSSTTGTLGATTALSDQNGVARTTFSTSQTATVTAIAGSARGEVQVTVSTAPTVTIDVGAGPFTVGVPVPITITPQGGTGTNTSPRQIATVVVEFGDGTSQTLRNITGAVGLTHTYNQAGGYTITATSTDVTGNTGISSRAIVVQRQQLPTVTLSAPATTTTTTATPITFTASATAPAQIVSARVTLQDGTVIFSGTGANTFSYRFGGAGTYTLTGTATDSNGNTATTTTSIVVTP